MLQRVWPRRVRQDTKIREICILRFRTKSTFFWCSIGVLALHVFWRIPVWDIRTYWFFCSSFLFPTPSRPTPVSAWRRMLCQEFSWGVEECHHLQISSQFSQTIVFVSWCASFRYLVTFGCETLALYHGRNSALFLLQLVLPMFISTSLQTASTSSARVSPHPSGT